MQLLYVIYISKRKGVSKTSKKTDMLKSAARVKSNDVPTKLNDQAPKKPVYVFKGRFQ
jgi:hypothetical protein